MKGEKWVIIGQSTNFHKLGLPCYATVTEYLVKTIDYCYIDHIYNEKLISTRVEYRVDVVNKNGLSDRPCQYADGRIVYDHPEWYPKYAKALVKQAFEFIANIKGISK